MVAALVRVTGEQNWQSKRGAAVHRKFSISMRSAAPMARQRIDFSAPWKNTIERIRLSRCLVTAG